LTRRRPWLQQAAEAAQRALTFEPHSIQGHRFAAELADARGDHARAAELYRRTLELSDQAYLDPLKQLTDAQRQAIRRRLEQGPTP